MWIRESEWKSPNTFSSHRTTAMTTTPFKIDLICPLHGDEAIHQPQEDAHHDQNFQQLN